MENKNEEQIKNQEEIKKSHNTASIVCVIVGVIILIAIICIFIFNNCEIKSKLKIFNMDNRNNNSSTGELVVKKPVIYLYPEESIELSVKLGKPEKITCSYPKYNDGWKVIASPDGNLTDINTGRNLYSLYWEGLQTYNSKVQKDGFVVKGEDVVQFLEEKLSILGLNEKETEEFIIYWLPKLEANKYNYIRFATMEEINDNMPLEINPKPDTIIRVLMFFKGLDNPIEVQEQKIVSPERNGFVAVEWGGTEIK